MDVVANLIAKTYTQNAFGEQIETETSTQVFATLEEIARSEFFEAAAMALSPSFRARTAAINYSGQRVLELNGERYAIYRTYTSGDEIELYCEMQAGVTYDGNDPD